MATYRYPVIAREGWIPIAFLLVSALFSHQYDQEVLAAVLFLLGGALAWFFRDPPRRIPPLPLAVVSPADARVMAVEEMEEPRTGRIMVRVRLTMNPTGVFSLRSPIEGKVMRAWFPGTEGNPEPFHVQWVQSDEGDDVVVALNPRRRSGRILCQAAAGERIGQGQRCGFLPFGAVVDVYVPTATRIMVEPGEGVLSGVSVIARLVRK